jgi:hypothetical protein
VKRITEAPRHRSHPDDALAIELGPRNVRVNAILPGVAEGERMDRVISTRAQALGISFDQMKDERLEKISLRRMVTVHDAAAMTPFLASPAGRNIPVRRSVWTETTAPVVHHEVVAAILVGNALPFVPVSMWNRRHDLLAAHRRIGHRRIPSSRRRACCDGEERNTEKRKGDKLGNDPPVHNRTSLP